MQVVSVVIPVYNALPYLEQALESVRVQTHDSLQVVCVNDGSTDGSLDVMRSFAERDARFELIDQENQGYGAACNNGLSAARGEWVAVLEPDDWLDPEYFEEALAFAARFGSDADVVKTPYWRVLSGETRRIPCNFKGRKVKSQPFPVREQPWLLEEHPSIWSALYRRSFLEENGISFPEYPGAGWADNVFLIDTLCRARRIVYCDRAFYCYRESTLEESRRFLSSNRLLPFDRWMEMTERIEALGLEDAGVLVAHYKRGFAYLSDVVDAVGENDPSVRRASDAMMGKMRADLVLGSGEIAPRYKRAFSAARNVSAPSVRRVSYLRHRVAALARKARALGMGGAIGLVRHRLAGKRGFR